MRFRYKQWLLHGMPAAEAYSEWATVHVVAKAYLQARTDAAAALRLLHMPATDGKQVSPSIAPARAQPQLDGAAHPKSGKPWQELLEERLDGCRSRAAHSQRRWLPRSCNWDMRWLRSLGMLTGTRTVQQR